MTSPWWSQVNGTQLSQGDLLPDCFLPVFSILADGDTDRIFEGRLDRARLIVITQSCDLENGKAVHVALCPVYGLDEFERAQPESARKGTWENVRKGRVERLHMLGSPESPENNRDALIVDFGHIVSLPFEYLSGHAESLEHRWRLEPPFLEHFSQAFARFFMRVGLPSSIAPFR